MCVCLCVCIVVVVVVVEGGKRVGGFPDYLGLALGVCVCVCVCLCDGEDAFLGVDVAGVEAVGGEELLAHFQGLFCFECESRRMEMLVLMLMLMMVFIII